MEKNTGKTMCLFDVDGTLTAPRKVIESDMKEFLLKLQKKVTVALVGGSDIDKILEQLGNKEAINDFEYIFSENGLVAHHKGQLMHKKSIAEYMGEAKLQAFINYALGYMSKLELPVKRGTFVEFRSGLINICPVGRSCSQEERDQFEVIDKVKKIRETFVADMRKNFGHEGLNFAIGGQISIDVFPQGWDKRYCLQFVEKEYSPIYFFGDKTDQGGNDHEIFADERTIGHSVKNPADTISQLSELFFK